MEATVPNRYLPVTTAKLVHQAAEEMSGTANVRSDILQAPHHDEKDDYWTQENNRVLNEIHGDGENLKDRIQ
jgi:hypothetical protein